MLFPILVLAGDANLTWIAPTTNTDGSQLEDLSGYRIYRDQGADPIASTIEPYYLDNGLSTGDYDWHVTAVNSEGVESDPSNVASKSIFDDTGLPGKPIVYLAQGPPDSPMTDATVYIDFDNTDGGRDGSAGNPYNSFDEFQTARADTLTQAMHVYVTGEFDSTDPFTLAGWGTSSSNTLTLDGQGTAIYNLNTGYDTITIAAENVIIENFTFNIKATNSEIYAGGSSAGLVIRNNIITATGSANASYVIKCERQFSLINNLITVGDGASINDVFFANGIYSTYSPFNIYNNTIIGGEDSCIYITSQGSGTVNLKNNILQGNDTADYEDDGLSGVTFNTAANISSDATSPDGGVWINKTLDFAGVDDYHLDSSDTEATDTGEVLSGIFTDDLEGTTRSNWSVGAYEFVSGGITLVIQAPTHTHSVDNIDLTQAHTLAMQDSAHVHSADNIGLTQAHVLALEDAAHTHAADNIDLIQAHVLAIQDALHAHAVENIDLTQAHILALEDAAHALAVDNIDLTQAHVLIVQDATHTHTVDNIDLITAGILGVNDSTHIHAADNIDLTQAHVLALEDAAHSHAVDNIGLITAGVLGVNDAEHGISSDIPALTQAHILVVADAGHDHTAGNIDLETGILLSVQDATHAVTVPNVDLTQAHVLVVDDALHTVLSDLIRLNYGEAVIIPAGRSIVFADMRHCMSFTDDSHSITVH